MWGALQTFQSLTKDTLNQAQQLLEKLDGDNEEIEEEDPDGRIDDGDEDEVKMKNATDQDTPEVSKEVVQVSACRRSCWYQ